ncbi:MAG: hypothetical protein U9O86_03150 [Campylobacterota bacterium]|nr:hypothetical protein [Campylobacterota bacterium]
MQFDKDLNSEQAELFLDVRAFITEEIEKYVQKVREKYSDNITSLFCREFSGGFCYLRVKDAAVHIGWFCGVKISDKHGLLFGNGKQIRGQKVRVLGKKEKEAIAYYVKESYLVLIEKEELKKARR